MKIKRGDMVVVVAGAKSGKTPRVVQQVLDGGKKVVVEGVNEVFKHVKRGHPKSPQGGRLKMEKPIDSSNVMFYCSKCDQGTKLGVRFLDDGSKERHCRKCGTSISQVSPARDNHAVKK